jgi:hypothetical protein
MFIVTLFFFALLHRKPPCVEKQIFILDLLVLGAFCHYYKFFIFEIYIKFCVFEYPGGLNNKFLDPSYVLVRFFVVTRGRTHAI